MEDYDVFKAAGIKSFQAYLETSGSKNDNLKQELLQEAIYHFLEAQYYQNKEIINLLKNKNI